MIMTIKQEQDNSIQGIIDEYLKLVFGILALFPIDTTSINKFILGNFERKDYNINFLTNFKNYIKFYVIYIISLIIGLWWASIIGPLFILFFLLLLPNALYIILISILVIIVLILLALIIGLIYFYIKSFVYKLIINHFGGDLNFNEAATLIFYSSILILTFSMPLVLSYAIFIGFIFSIILSILPFYALYFIYKELVSKFKMNSKKALYSVVLSFIIEYVFFTIPFLIIYFSLLIMGLI